MRSFTKGDVIYHEGEPCDSLFIIVSGEVEITGKSVNYIAVEGEVIGEPSLAKHAHHTETAIAKSAIKLEPLSEEHIERLVAQTPAGLQKTVRKIFTDRQSGNANHTAPLDSLAKVAESLERITNLLDKRCDTIERKLNHSSSTPEETAQSSGQKFRERNKEMAKHMSELGPILPLINDETINDVLINGHNKVFIERAGLLEKTDVTFNDDNEVFDVAESIVKALGRKIDINRPLVDARLADGSRVNIIAPPLAVDGTNISIRKFSKKGITLDKMVENNNISEQISEFLKVVGRCRLNVIISGGTGSGKTTLLNAISHYIDKDERIVTIEDAAELQLQQPHVVRLETRPYHPGMKMEDEVSMRDLVKNSLRMRPDRIIVGEVRGPEAFDMLQAMNSGHEGSLTTIHSNHPRDALSRLENMISMADLQIPIKSLRYQIASALHLIIQISRMRDGHRRITFISEVVGMEGDMITMHDLFTYKSESETPDGKLLGKFKWSGIMPRFTRRIEYFGEIPRLEKALGIKFPKNALNSEISASIN